MRIYGSAQEFKVLFVLDNSVLFPYPDEFANELLGKRPGVGDWGSCFWLPAFIFAADQKDAIFSVIFLKFVVSN